MNPMIKDRFAVAMATVLLCSVALAQAQAPAGSAVPTAATAQTGLGDGPTRAGVVSLVGGDVRIISSGKPAHRAAIGDAINEGDTLVTGKDSEVHVNMQDAGFIALRPNTRVQIASYKADGGDDDRGVFRLVAGGLRSITGWIGKFNQKSYQVRTPDATIGIRGTDHETRYLPPGSADGPPGTYDKVFAGETSIQTRAGQTEVDPDQAGFVSSDAGVVPRVLATVPTFFQPGPNEALINAKHAEIQKIIDQRRDERRKVVDEKRATLAQVQVGIKALSEDNKSAADQRIAASDQQRQSGEQQRAALSAMDASLQSQQKAIASMRKVLMRETSADIASDPILSAHLKVVRDAVADIRNGYVQLRTDRKQLSEKNMAATEARKAALETQRHTAEQQWALWTEKLQVLQQRQKTVAEMRLSIQQQAAADPAKSDSLNGQRRQANALADEATRLQQEYVDGTNLLFTGNMAQSQASMADAVAQRVSTEAELSALNAREERLRQMQSATERSLEEIEEASVHDASKLDRVRDQIAAVRSAADVLRQSRLDIQAARYTLSLTEMAAVKERQQDAIDRMQKMRETHQDLEAKIVDLQNENASMQQEIRSLYEQEDRRYREELKADRQQRVTVGAPQADD